MVLVDETAADPRLELLDRQSRIEVERAVGTLAEHRAGHLVVLVRDVADDGLDQVLDGEQPVDAAVFVDDEGEVDARLAHLQQQVEHRHLRGDHQRVAQDVGELELLGAAAIGVDVLDVDHADDVIELLAVDGQAGMAFATDLFQRLLERHLGLHGDDVGARHHHVVSGLAGQAQHVVDQRALLAVELRRAARRLGRLGGLLHQLGDRASQTLLAAPAPAEQAEQRQPEQRRARSRSAAAHRGFHGLGTPSRCSRRASASSMRLASPAL